MDIDRQNAKGEHQAPLTPLTPPATTTDTTTTTRGLESANDRWKLAGGGCGGVQCERRGKQEPPRTITKSCAPPLCRTMQTQEQLARMVSSFLFELLHHPLHARLRSGNASKEARLRHEVACDIERPAPCPCRFRCHFFWRPLSTCCSVPVATPAKALRPISGVGDVGFQRTNHLCDRPGNLPGVQHVQCHGGLWHVEMIRQGAVDSAQFYRSQPRLSVSNDGERRCPLCFFHVALGI